MNDSPNPLVLGALVMTLLLPCVGWAESAWHYAEESDAVDPGDRDLLLIDRDAPPGAKYRLAPNLWWGSKLSLELESENNYDLDRSDPDDVIEAEPQAKLSLAYRPSDGFEGFVSFSLERKYALKEQEDDKDRQLELNVKRAYLTFHDLIPETRAVLGRQRLKDERQWYYDKVVEGLRLYYRKSDLHLDASISQRNLVEGDGSVVNYFLRGQASPAKDLDLEAFFLLREDTSNEEGRRQWLGVRAMGEALDELEYWADAAYAWGRLGRDSDDKKLRGYAVDVGATYIFDIRYEPSVTLAYAFGSGDSNPDDNTDRNFRQTGLHDNSAKFNGVVRLNYYGEVFDPELSNLQILTAGVGIRPSRKSSVDLVYHHFFQDEISDEFLDVDIDEDPDEDRSSVGNELDLIFGARLTEQLDMELITGYFWPGSAFDDDTDPAFLVKLELEYEF